MTMHAALVRRLRWKAFWARFGIDLRWKPSGPPATGNCLYCGSNSHLQRECPELNP